MLRISRNIVLPDEEIVISFVRAQGAGGQNVNKVSSAVHLRFNIQASSLPDFCKERLLKLSDRRITRDGEIVIKAQQHRSQEKNREEALQRLQKLIQSVAVTRKKRKPTNPTRASREKRLERKTRRGKLKTLRGKVSG